jgi:protocatechuate 3,4-dioxygenase beta subunit
MNDDSSWKDTPNRDADIQGDRDAGNVRPRRDFLKRAALATATTLFLPAYLLGADRIDGDCTPTSLDIEGPYYKSGSPFRVTLAAASEPGDVLRIAGVVYANDCTTPIEGVTVDVWAANDEGCYNNTTDCSPHSDDVYNLRGRMLTNQRGEYAFTTVKPGRYLNGGTYRPSHVHFRVTAPGFPQFTTQLYFEGDPYIPVDPWASKAEAAPRIIPLAAVNNGLDGVFDITLDVPPTISGVSEGAGATGSSELSQNVPNPFDADTSIPYRVARQGRVELAIYDMLGRRVRTLVSSMHGAGSYAERWDGSGDNGERLPAGIYACRLQAGSFSQSRMMTLAAR